MDIQNLKSRYGIIGNDPKLLLALNKAVQVAATDLSILITGESGVGKDVFSRIIHDNGPRKHKNLISVNCGAIPEGTIESELFGHVKGSFTGADRSRKGYFEEADGGTIFLDEVGELPLSMQVKLLRVLENGEITPVGASIPQKVNVRVVAATNVDILAAVRQGRFREDLYYRLNQISISIPPLRERKEDIPLLFRKFSSDISDHYNMPPIFLDDAAKLYLQRYPWYGNIRELKNITDQISVIEKDRLVTCEILDRYLSIVPEETHPTLFVGGNQTGNANTITDRELLLKALTMGQMINEMRNEISDLRQAVTHLAQGMPVSVEKSSAPAYTNPITILDTPHNQPPVNERSGINVLPSHTESHASEDEVQEAEVVENPVSETPLALEEREKEAIRLALERHKGKRRPAAQELHISERTLYRKIKTYNLEDK